MITKILPSKKALTLNGLERLDIANQYDKLMWVLRKYKVSPRDAHLIWHDTIGQYKPKTIRRWKVKPKE